MGSGREEVRRVDPDDDEVAEAWLRETDEPEVRGVSVLRLADGGRWPWQVGLDVAGSVRDDLLESELRRDVAAALRTVTGVEDVAEQDREVWVVRGDPSGAALTAAAAGVVDAMALRLRAADLG